MNDYQKLNLAKSTNYKMNFAALPGVDFWLMTANIPTITSNEVPIPNPIHGNTYRPSNTIYWAPLMFTFLVDEDYSNYFELYSWFQRMSGSDVAGRELHDKDLQTTGSIHILSNNKNVSDVVFTFHNAFPTIMGEIQLNNESSEPIMTDVTLQYDYMTMET